MVLFTRGSQEAEDLLQRTFKSLAPALVIIACLHARLAARVLRFPDWLYSSLVWTTGAGDLGAFVADHMLNENSQAQKRHIIADS